MHTDVLEAELGMTLGLVGDEPIVEYMYLCTD